MAFSTFEAFWLMEGHGSYVWLSYGIWFATVGGLVVSSCRNRRSTLKMVKDRWEEFTESE